MPPRLRIAWLGQRSRGAGDGLITYSREITAGLRKRGAAVVFVHHDASSAGHHSIALDALAVGDRFRISAPGSSRRLVEALRRHRVDLVHVSLSFSSLDFSLPTLCHELGLPVVATFHAPFDTHATMWAGLSRVLYQVYAASLARYDRVVVFGPSQGRMLTSAGVPPQVVRVVPNGVDVDRYRPGPADRTEAGGSLFVYLGRLDREKNVDVLIDAFLAEDPPPGTRLVLVGAGPERARLERRARDPRVVFLGAVADEAERIALLQSADALFLPSSIEGLSLALLEGMACGACPVATDVGCDGDAVRGAGVLLDPVRLRSDVRLAVRLLTSTPEVARHLGRLARRRAVERYSLSRNIDALLGIYEELLGRSPHRGRLDEAG
jgi:glycosyltransferase involved in cell wall biosynthesis